MKPHQRLKKKVERRTPKGRTTAIHVQKKPSKHLCALCGAELHGVPNRCVSEMRKLSKTEKRPERVFGGTLCARCVSSLIKEQVRLENGVISKGDVPLTHLKFIKMLK